eukprot:s1025_g13.t1
MKACCNAGAPMQVEWDQVERGFVDGFGLCSPTRWRPSQRGERRSDEMVKLANDTFGILEEAAVDAIPDMRRAAFELVTGKLEKFPFSDEALGRLRDRWFSLYIERQDLLKVFPKKLKHRRLDETEFNRLAENYPSAQLSSHELEEKFREEEGMGRMRPSRLGVLKQEFGDRLRVAAMAAILKPDGSMRPLYDAAHSVMVNHEIVYQDKIMSPELPEIASVVRETKDSGEAAFCVSADIKAARRLVKVRRADWGLLCCKADSSSDTIWVNRNGTFGVSSAPFWWAKLAGGSLRSHNLRMPRTFSNLLEILSGHQQCQSCWHRSWRYGPLAGCRLGVKGRRWKYRGTDNRANESLTSRRSTTKRPLMAVNMQLSSSLAKCRLSLNLKWRPREENVEADSLTNEDFSSFDMSKRIIISFRDMDLSILDAMVDVWNEFEDLKFKSQETPRAPKQEV